MTVLFVSLKLNGCVRRRVVTEQLHAYDGLIEDILQAQSTMSGDLAGFICIIDILCLCVVSWYCFFFLVSP